MNTKMNKHVRCAHPVAHPRTNWLVGVLDGEQLVEIADHRITQFRIDEAIEERSRKVGPCHGNPIIVSSPLLIRATALSDDRNTFSPCGVTL